MTPQDAIPVDDAGAGRMITTEHAAAGARWRFSLWTPTLDLLPLVASMWESSGEVPWSRERLLPTGTVDLIVNLGAPAYLLDRDDSRRRERFATVFVSGMQSGHLVLETAARTHTMGVALRPARARAILGVPMSELADRVVLLDDVVGGSAERLRDRLLDAASPAARFRMLEAWLRGLISSAARGDQDEGIGWAVETIARCRGDVRIDALASALGASRKGLAARFRAEVGLTPKAFARVQRFTFLLARLDGGAPTTLSEVAHEAGYHDHAHFTRDFKTFTGATPSQYLQLRTPYAGGMVDE